MDAEKLKQCKTCEYRRHRHCFMCRHYDAQDYCEHYCAGKHRFETERRVCPECGKEWDE